MREVVTNVYKFDELDDRAKEKAREWFRSVGGNTDDDWYDHIYDDFMAICEAMGIELDTYPVKLMGGGVRMKPAIYFSGFSSQGDGACFEGVYRSDVHTSEAIRKHAPQDAELHAIADRLVELSSAYPEGVFVRVIHRGRYCHANTMWVDNSGANEVLNEETQEWCEPELTNEDDFLDCLRDLANWLYSTLEKEYEFRDSDEQIDESIRCNDYEFTVDGNIH
jgi:hypothetical protein